MVISPDTQSPRLDAILSRASGLLYTTLFRSLPIAAGFGISSPDYVRMLDGLADVAVVGSHIINLMDAAGLGAVDEFLAACTSVGAKNFSPLQRIALATKPHT